MASLTAPVSPWRLSVAPMMEWTDRHCRVFHRSLSRHTRLYTEMAVSYTHLDVYKRQASV